MTIIQFAHPFRMIFRLLPRHKAILLSATYFYRRIVEEIICFFLTLRYRRCYRAPEYIGAVINTGDGPWLGYQLPTVNREDSSWRVKKVFRAAPHVIELLQGTRYEAVTDVGTPHWRKHIGHECGCLEESPVKDSRAINFAVTHYCAAHQKLFKRWPQLNSKKIAEPYLTPQNARKILDVWCAHRTKLSHEEITELIETLENEQNGYGYDTCWTLHEIVIDLLEDTAQSQLPEYAQMIKKLIRPLSRIRHVKFARDDLDLLKERFGATPGFEKLEKECAVECRKVLRRCHIRIGLWYLSLASLIMWVWWWHLPDWRTGVTLAVTLISFCWGLKVRDSKH